jgi:quercetin dioxygenase-like cupin family protein
MCFHRFTDGFQAPVASGHREQWLEGANLAFGFAESPAGHSVAEKKAAHELFVYILAGMLDARLGRVKKKARAGDVIHVPRGTA